MEEDELAPVLWFAIVINLELAMKHKVYDEFAADDNFLICQNVFLQSICDLSWIYLIENKKVENKWETIKTLMYFSVNQIQLQENYILRFLCWEIIYSRICFG